MSAFADERTALYYATVYQRLRAKGRPIPTNDLWIAATALQHACALFSFDAHFQAGVRLLPCNTRVRPVMPWFLTSVKETSWLRTVLFSPLAAQRS